MEESKQLRPVRNETSSERGERRNIGNSLVGEFETPSKLSNGVRNIVEQIVNSYESKVKTVTSLMKEVHQRVKNYHIEQEQMTNRSRDILAKNECLRKKDFDTMIAGIRSQQEAREKEVSQMVEDFCKEEEETVAKLKEILTVKSASTLEDFKVLKERMLNRPKEREKRVSQMLKDFHRDQEELNTAFRMLLGKGSSVRIKDFKAMVKAFQIERRDENAEVDRVLEEFERVKDEISNQWQKVMVTVGGNR